MATEKELSDFLKSVERRAFKRSIYHVRDEEAALDIVQDSMMKLAEHYADKPAEELPMLFQRILSNCTLDWFRRQKTRNALFSNMSDFESAGDRGKSGYTFNIQMENGKVTNNISGSAVARDLYEALKGDETIKAMLQDKSVKISVGKTFMLSIKTVHLSIFK